MNVVGVASRASSVFGVASFYPHREKRDRGVHSTVFPGDSGESMILRLDTTIGDTIIAESRLPLDRQCLSTAPRPK